MFISIFKWQSKYKVNISISAKVLSLSHKLLQNILSELSYQVTYVKIQKIVWVALIFNLICS